MTKFALFDEFGIYIPATGIIQQEDDDIKDARCLLNTTAMLLEIDIDLCFVSEINSVNRTPVFKRSR